MAGSDIASEQVNQIWLRILGREATPREKSKYRLYNQYMLEDIARTILVESSEQYNNQILKNKAAICGKVEGVSLVSPFNKMCGISTYTENLFFELERQGIRCSVISENCAERDECIKPKDNTVTKFWSIGCGDLEYKILEGAYRFKNKIIHIQHEFGLFPDNEKLKQLIILLKNCGFKVVITMHTVLRDKSFDKFYSLADVIIVHNETTASRLYGAGINNLTVIEHGTENPIDPAHFSLESMQKMIRSYFPDFNFAKDKLGSSIGFISKDKKQVETLEAANIIANKRDDFYFLMIGNTGRRSYDDEYFPELKKLESDRVKVVKKFLSDKEIAEILYASQLSVMNYHPTNYSISGASHLLMSYNVPSVSSNSIILSDLDESVSIKVDCENVDAIASGIEVILNDNSLYQSMVKNLQSKAEVTKWKNLVEKKYRPLYEGLWKS